jgi:16S rRNA processing protein RimM
MPATTRSISRPAKIRATTTPRAQTPNEANAGRIAGVFGLRGELKLAASRIGEDALAEGVAVRAVLADGGSRAVRVRSLRRHQNRPLIAFEGVDDATAAQAFAGATLMIGRGDVALGAGEYFDDDLVGCALIDEHGAALADVVAVEHYPAQDVLVVALRRAQGDTTRTARGDAMRAMVPLVGAFVKEIDVGAKRISVELPPGLIDLRQADEA